MYDGHLAGFYLCECAEVYSYIYLHKDVYIFE